MIHGIPLYRDTVKKILFVCLGNICRSPAAEGIMNALIQKSNFKEKIICDSAGTANYHVGQLSDPRMRKQASLRGYELTHLARQFNPQEDFKIFDYIITMDNHHFQTLKAWDSKGQWKDKIFKMAEFCKKFEVKEIPDPYYNEEEGFNDVLDLLEDACEGLMQKIKNDSLKS